MKIGAGAAVAVANGISHERRVVVGRMSEFGDNASLVEAEEDISHEQLQMIKARTMFQMTEEIADDSGGGRNRATHDANAAFGTSVLCTLSGVHSALSAQ